MERMRFEFPTENQKGMKEIKDRMRNFEEAETVDDSQEARFIAAKSQFIMDPRN